MASAFVPFIDSNELIIDNFDFDMQNKRSFSAPNVHRNPKPITQIQHGSNAAIICNSFSSSSLSRMQKNYVNDIDFSNVSNKKNNESLNSKSKMQLKSNDQYSETPVSTMTHTVVARLDDSSVIEDSDDYSIDQETIQIKSNVVPTRSKSVSVLTYPTRKSGRLSPYQPLNFNNNNGNGSNENCYNVAAAMTFGETPNRLHFPVKKSFVKNTASILSNDLSDFTQSIYGIYNNSFKENETKVGAFIEIGDLPDNSSGEYDKTGKVHPYVKSSSLYDSSNINYNSPNNSFGRSNCSRTPSNGKLHSDVNSPDNDSNLLSFELFDYIKPNSPITFPQKKDIIREKSINNSNSNIAGTRKQSIDNMVILPVLQGNNRNHNITPLSTTRIINNNGNSNGTKISNNINNGMSNFKNKQNGNSSKLSLMRSQQDQWQLKNKENEVISYVVDSYIQDKKQVNIVVNVPKTIDFDSDDEDDFNLNSKTRITRPTQIKNKYSYSNTMTENVQSYRSKSNNPNNNRKIKSFDILNEKQLHQGSAPLYKSNNNNINKSELFNQNFGSNSFNPLSSSKSNKNVSISSTERALNSTMSYKNYHPLTENTNNSSPRVRRYSGKK